MATASAFLPAKFMTASHLRIQQFVQLHPASRLAWEALGASFDTQLVRSGGASIDSQSSGQQSTLEEIVAATRRFSI